MSKILKIAGMPNLHSHAFQRAMAGLTERQTNPSDSFWTWRELMYRFASRITPEQLHAIAAQLYVEMLEAGYTSVCEFHYLHHQPNGLPYENSAAMSQAIIQAAQDAGIRLTLLPVLYMTGGFDGRALNDQQKRFSHSVENFLGLIAKLQAQENDKLKIGIALHSLRAVPEKAIHEVLAGLSGRLPIHIHISEQIAEVNECIATRNARPVQWLMDNVDVNQDWTLVHATHLDDAEVASIAKSKATVAICTTTEANLGDGFFRLRDFIAAGGAFGIGSDSNTSISPVEELRWLEYGQRLLHQQRNIAVTSEQTSVGEFLWQKAVHDGRVSTQQDCSDDYLMLDAETAAMAGVNAATLYDRLVFGGNRSLIKDVFVANKQLISDGMHSARESIAANYSKALNELLA
ncbi:MAG TPA: formimidoylglutamate deiminase [Arenimonas sp.]|nr:formimidoylglutamate deiminase [Arenimonas sp.]HPO24869.1 formimidoylglutamate deiminase [Arenimonas sp.]